MQKTSEETKLEVVDQTKHLKPVLDLLNYAAKTVNNHNLTSANMSFILEDIKYEVSVTK